MGSMGLWYWFGGGYSIYMLMIWICNDISMCFVVYSWFVIGVVLLLLGYTGFGGFGVFYVDIYSLWGFWGLGVCVLGSALYCYLDYVVVYVGLRMVNLVL